MEGKVKISNRHRIEIFNQILTHVKENLTIDDIVIAGDLNQWIGSTKVQ